MSRPTWGNAMQRRTAISLSRWLLAMAQRCRECEITDHQIYCGLAGYKDEVIDELWAFVGRVQDVIEEIQNGRKADEQ